MRMRRIWRTVVDSAQHLVKLYLVGQIIHNRLNDKLYLVFEVFVVGAHYFPLKLKFQILHNP